MLQVLFSCLLGHKDGFYHGQKQIGSVVGGVKLFHFNEKGVSRMSNITKDVRHKQMSYLQQQSSHNIEC